MVGLGVGDDRDALRAEPPEREEQPAGEAVAGVLHDTVRSVLSNHPVLLDPGGFLHQASGLPVALQPFEELVPGPALFFGGLVPEHIRADGVQ